MPGEPQVERRGFLPLNCHSEEALCRSFCIHGPNLERRIGSRRIFGVSLPGSYESDIPYCKVDGYGQVPSSG